ncbi:CopL family metal-binding regulatory protein [Tahibacter caeni]|uniref:CopL family metal-binding regulatory protein n=1 Tax=Tahibacter caeni TaxID=1453545 RepID=UPI002147C131
MLRIAVRLLLALLLCFNGLVAPVAMAAMPAAAESGQSADAATAATHCRGDDAAPAPAADDGGHDHNKHSSCCKPGHCACACTFSLNLPVSTYAGDAVGSRREQPLPRLVALPALRDGVPLRPPIV